MPCLGYEGYTCKKVVKNSKALRCDFCREKHRALSKARQKETAHLRQSRGHQPERFPELEKPGMSMKEYSKLVDYLKNLPE